MVDISVVMAVYNEEDFIRDAMDSILGQTGPETELIIVDDLSTDGTARIVEERAARDARVRFFHVPKKGKVRAFNLGVSQARGEWVCLFAGDDLMPPDSLNERYQAVKDQPKDTPVIGTCRLITMSENKKLDGQVVPRNPNKQTYSGVCFLMNRGAVARMWPVPEILPNEDTWMELAARYLGMRSIVSSTIGAKWRIHSGNSINMMVPYDEFNHKLSARMIAPELFLSKHCDELTPEAAQALAAHARCERARKQGSILGIVRSGVPLVDALRAIALSGPWLYAIRRRAYKLLSGW